MSVIAVPEWLRSTRALTPLFIYKPPIHLALNVRTRLPFNVVYMIHDESINHRLLILIPVVIDTIPFKWLEVIPRRSIPWYVGWNNLAIYGCIT